MENTKIREFRSDTMTLPTPQMRQAMAEAAVGDDVCGEDPTVQELEALGARLVGKEAAVFVPSGVFGNQCALAVHGRPGDEVILPEPCHIIAHENGSAAALWGLMTRTVAPTRETYLTASDIEPRLRRHEELHEPRTRIIVLENALSDGTVMPVAAMREVRQLADQVGAVLHLDGARLFNAALALGVSAAEIAQPADSVMFCLSKGLGAPIGSLLAGSRSFVEAARGKRKSMGGGMRQVGVLAAPGILALTHGTAQLALDHAHAALLARGLATIPGVELDVAKVVTNMVWIRIHGPGKSEPGLVEHLLAERILTYPPMGPGVRFVTSSRIDATDVSALVDSVARYLR